ncbi:MAG: hypothetical protein K1X72_01200 [Pyrinomonadaceae bacterium]|nr:hypothetical protein [Pyrinomonadaceae bacterium]
MTNRNKVSLVEFINPSRNYLLLIIGLVVLVCLAVSLSVSSANLEPNQRWFLILFLTFFPVFGLGLSIWLILRHFRKLFVNEKDDEIPWQIMSPEKQQRKLNKEVTELAALLEIPQSQLSDLRSAYIVGEDLALRNIEQEGEISLKRHVSLEKADFDAILIDNELIKCIDVTFLVTPDISQEKVNSILRKVDSTKKILNKIRPHTKLVLLLVLVTQLDQAAETQLRSTVADKFSNTPVDVEIRWFDFETLQRIYTA